MLNLELASGNQVIKVTAGVILFDVKDTLIQEKKRRFEPCPGAVALLEKLKSAGADIATISSVFGYDYLELAGLGNYFQPERCFVFDKPGDRVTSARVVALRKRVDGDIVYIDDDPKIAAKEFYTRETHVIQLTTEVKAPVQIKGKWLISTTNLLTLGDSLSIE